MFNDMGKMEPTGYSIIPSKSKIMLFWSLVKNVKATERL